AGNWVRSIYQDGEGYLWFGTNGGVSRYDGQHFTTFTTKDGLASNNVWSMLKDREGYFWFGTRGGGVSRYDGQNFASYTSQDGLRSNQTPLILQDSEDHLWFGTAGGGVSRYDGQHFTTFTTQNGLASNRVLSMLKDRDGCLWFGTEGGVSRYDGQHFTTFTTQNGLADNGVRSIFQDREGHLWFGTGSGVSRYDGMTFTTFTREDGLADNYVWSIWQDSEDYLWFGTFGGGVSRYDGMTFTTFTTEDGLAGNVVLSIWQDSEGYLWFGTEGGVSRYDGMTFTTFTTEDGLAENMILSILQDSEYHFWFGTDSGGVSQYDGHHFTTFTTEDGLADNQVRSIYQDSEGNLWFGCYGGVVSKYDGQVFQTLTSRDGLTGGPVRSILQYGEGSIWFATYNGVVRYRQPRPSPPPVFIDAVVADRRYQDISEVTIPSSVRLVAFEFHGRSFKTRPEAMVYRYRLVGYDEDWKNTNARRMEYPNIPRGSYTFEVIAVDRDLVYSENPATVELKIMPPFYLRAGFLAPTISFGSILLATLVILATALINRRRQVHAYQQAAVLELQDAREMQMSLMPESAPPIEGVEIAGKCVPANTVSGDFFDYLEGNRPHEIALVVADVMGKAMKGAMNAMMTSGILRMAAKGQEQLSPSSLMMEINDVLKSRTERLMNVTMVIGVIDVANKILTIANAGILPLLLRHGKVLTLKLGDLPLGMISGIKYTEEQFPLQSSDVVILMTDGIIEVQNSDEQFYSDSGRLEETIGKFTLDLSAEAMVDAILNDAMNFGGDKTQRDDDMTVVVAKIQ
ncbi:SpoIIE family protein phosphatase, partial [bacterium]|nr:SpoIIE family protein phosphatase [bacterium]